MSGVATAGAIVGGAVIGGVATNMAAGTAADAQTAAADQANATQISMFNKAQANLQPYMTAGNTATTNALNLANTGFNFNDTQAQLEATPGYQFTLSQGLESTQNGAAASSISACCLKKTSASRHPFPRGISRKPSRQRPSRRRFPSLRSGPWRRQSWW